MIDGKLLLDLVDHDPDGSGPLAAVPWGLAASDVGLDGSAGGTYDLYHLTLSGVRLAAVAVGADLVVV